MQQLTTLFMNTRSFEFACNLNSDLPNPIRDPLIPSSIQYPLKCLELFPSEHFLKCSKQFMIFLHSSSQLEHSTTLIIFLSPTGLFKIVGMVEEKVGVTSVLQNLYHFPRFLEQV